MITNKDIETIQSRIEPILGQKAWAVKLSQGSFLTFNFGSKILAKNNTTKGEWFLWIYCCAWRLEKDEQILAGCEDSHVKIESAIKELEGLAIESIDILKPAWDTLFNFEQNIVLRVFTIYSEEVEHWMLFMPDRYVLTIGPGTEWSCVQEND